MSDEDGDNVGVAPPPRPIAPQGDFFLKMMKKILSVATFVATLGTYGDNEEGGEKGLFLLWKIMKNKGSDLLEKITEVNPANTLMEKFQEEQKVKESPEGGKKADVAGIPPEALKQAKDAARGLSSVGDIKDAEGRETTGAAVVAGKPASKAASAGRG